MIIVITVFFAFFAYILGLTGITAIVLGISFFFILRIIFRSTESFVFREFALALYALNYLIAPAITYSLDETLVQYPMKIPLDNYFSLALPGFILLWIGMYSMKTNCFKIDFQKVRMLSVVNEGFLRKVVIVGVLAKIGLSVFQGELNFILYLISLLRFVGSFALITINKKYFLLAGLILLFEIGLGFINGAYHDAIMWVIFFGLFYLYVVKPRIQQVIIGAASIVFLILIIQVVKFKYREEVWEGGQSASLSNALEVSQENVSTETMFGEENLLATLNRGNQAWIFASTVDNMDQQKNFQGFANVNKYLEAALLPRFLAPNKIESGSSEIFNEFSGHFINENTSMGLGIFADGYIAFGTWGVYLFALALGLLFSLTFKIIDVWTKVSPFYVLLLLPLLNYAVRPDCELQTTINHLFKGILLYGFLVYLTRKRFNLDSQENQRKLLHLNLATKK